ncbi:MAG TPA: AmmeMemoRadiSam system protein A, partial [Synergistaceae bacterium]|nr:AmmeMemoRadiSam system protein A [Synergistaceae bacterium]
AKRAACFVSLKKRGALRGCIGTILPRHESLAEEIEQNSVAAATQDPRFPPVGLEELSDIEISVDILSEPEAVTDLRELDPKRYGVIVERGGRRGVLLPDLEGVDSVEEQLAIAARKAGLPGPEGSAILRFTVRRIREVPLP